MPWQYQIPENLTTPEEKLEHYIQTTSKRKEHLLKLGWRRLTSVEDSELEAELRNRFPFGNQPQPPAPNMIWNVSQVYASAPEYPELEADLNLKALYALRQCTTSSERILAIDWQHEWFSFVPHDFPNTGDSYDWAIPILPDGDCYVFLPCDFRFGIYGFPHSTICVCGQDLLTAIDSHLPTLFSKRIDWTTELLTPNT